MATDGHPFRDLRAVLADVGRAACEAVFYRRAIFDPPPWPTRYRLFLRPKVKR